MLKLPNAEVLFPAIYINVGCPPWGGIPSTSPNMLRVLHLTRFNVLWVRGNKHNNNNNMTKTIIIQDMWKQVFSKTGVFRKNTKILQLQKNTNFNAVRWILSCLFIEIFVKNNYVGIMYLRTKNPPDYVILTNVLCTI